MEKNFKSSLMHVLVHEGGWADHPRDPGGATMKGVTPATYQRYFGEDKNTAITMAGGSSQVIEEITPSVDYRIVKKGSSGLWVRKLQEALEIQVDGKFGIDTEAALKAWQQANGLEPDGIAGRNTYRALGLLA